MIDIMLVFALSVFALSLDAYEYEIDRGLAVESFVGSIYADPDDELSYGGGLRLSYSFANREDFYWTPEISLSAQRFKFASSSSGSNKIRNKFYASGLITIVEAYNPYIFRLSVGGGVEHRPDLDLQEQISATFNHRFGLGIFLNPEWAIYADNTGRLIFRNDSSPLTYEASLSLQYVF